MSGDALGRGPCPRALPQPPDGAAWAAGFVAMPVHLPAYSVVLDRRGATACWRLRDADELLDLKRHIARARDAFDRLCDPMPLEQAQPMVRALLEAAELHRTIREARRALVSGDRDAALALLELTPNPEDAR